MAVPHVAEPGLIRQFKVVGRFTGNNRPTIGYYTGGFDAAEAAKALASEPGVENVAIYQRRISRWSFVETVEVGA